MPRFIVVHSMPYNEEQIMATAKNMPSQLPSDVSWNVTYYAFEDNKFFCEWEAPNKDAGEQVFRSTQLPYDAIYPVRLRLRGGFGGGDAKPGAKPHSGKARLRCFTGERE